MQFYLDFKVWFRWINQHLWQNMQFTRKVLGFRNLKETLEKAPFLPYLFSFQKVIFFQENTLIKITLSKHDWACIMRNDFTPHADISTFELSPFCSLCSLVAWLRLWIIIFEYTKLGWFSWKSGSTRIFWYFFWDGGTRSR